uniref:NADH dehydrogenase subunit 2 n=1 Tax=Pediopsoides anchorides TaxID=3035251 RepID=UPI002411507B|nr:NADH dehydrogenase subunit 2 [Pediopsoides anchorides]WEP24771.1 NADH dehydrogenase subunit 2 [Pediopsoides anchorides]
MYLNLTKITFFNTMMIGVMISISSNNWVNMWTGMEIGVLSIIPMMTQEKISSDSSIKYFIVQSVSSSMMIMAIMAISLKMNFKIIIIQSMLIKIGASPFHVWMLSIVESISYYTMFMLLTVTKIPGLMVLSMLNEQIQIWSILSMMIGSIMAINQSSVKKILTYSSIYNLGIMMSSMNENQIWMNYMIIYSVMLLMLTPTMYKLKVNYLNQLMLNEIEYVTKISIWISLMSMAGLPPLIGFTAKMTMLEKMIMKKEILMTSMMLTSSMIMMFTYMRISFLSMMIQSTINKWTMVKNSNMQIKLLIVNLMMTPTMLTLKNLI